MSIVITKRCRKTTKEYKYLRVYFSFNNEEFYREYREEYFPIKKKTDIWYKLSITYRKEPSRYKTYKYEKYIIVPVTISLENNFNKSYDDYIFNIRNNKLKRICDE